MVDLHGVDLNLLVSLDALLRERNVTRAAQRLNLSQPALSAQLARLRELVADPLLVPSARGMLPSPRALELAEPLAALLAGLSDLLRPPAAFAPATARRDFVIAATDYGDFAVVMPFAQRIRTIAPGIRIAAVGFDSRRIAAQLETGEIDLLIGTPRMTPPGLPSAALLNERFVMAQRKGHPRGAARLTLAGYCALDHVLVSTSGGSFHGFMDEILAGLGRRRHVALSVQQFLLVPQFLAASDLVSTLPERLARAFTGLLDVFELPFETPGFSLAAAWHPRNEADAAHRWLRDSIRDAVASSSPPRHPQAARPRKKR